MAKSDSASTLDDFLSSLGVFDDSPHPANEEKRMEERPLPAAITSGSPVSEPLQLPFCSGPTHVHHELFSSHASGALRIHLMVSRPLDRAPPTCVLFLLDPFPELMSLACAHVLGRYGYDNASPLRRMAIVGIGHDPADYAAAHNGWNVEALRALRRRGNARGQDHRFCRLNYLPAVVS